MSGEQQHLDKSWQADLSTYGTIRIRVVVLPPKVVAAADEEESGPDTDALGEDEPLNAGASPLSAYLERKAHGRLCVVLLVNGQRHDGWDNSFIIRDLGFKLLRNRTMIAVDVDGLTHEAFTEIVQGSRQGFFDGTVMNAIRGRIVATLKKDPDLMRLQAEAEQEVAELQAGDENVRKKLDELIDAHDTAATTQAATGVPDAGVTTGSQHHSFGKPMVQNVVTGSILPGDPAQYPILFATPISPSIRLYPGIERSLEIHVDPEKESALLESVEARLEPRMGELRVVVDRTLFGAEVTLRFSTEAEIPSEEFPLTTTLHVFAKFKGHDELRMLSREIVVNEKPGERKKRQRPALTERPTFLRVVTRQPVKLVPDGPSAHVRVRWDGLDSLLQGARPRWKISARCTTLTHFPQIGLSEPQEGTFELLIDTPRGLLAKQVLEFQVEATGPEGQQLSASFAGEVSEAPSEPPKAEPRRLTMNAPEAQNQRRPPYELKYIHDTEWTSLTCWGDSEWSAEDVGSFSEPTASKPLTLLINADAAPLKAFKERLASRKLDENTVQERVNRYTTHVAFHLYQMYRFLRKRRDEQDRDDAVKPPDDADMRDEISRVATTLLQVMEVSFR